MNNQYQLSFDNEGSIATEGETKKRLDVSKISGSKAMQMLDLSRHAFEKIVQEGLITPVTSNSKKLYDVHELESFMKSDRYQELVSGTVDPRNSLNDLTGKDWLPETKSFFYQKGLGANHPGAQIEKLHPAPYSFQDIVHLVKFFTKTGADVLDPFGGVGSTAKACEVCGRVCTSIELSKVWHDLSIKRLETEISEGASKKHTFINGDSCKELLKIPPESIDFMVTSPPYWGILHKPFVNMLLFANSLDGKIHRDEILLGPMNLSDGYDTLEIAHKIRFLQEIAIVDTPLQHRPFRLAADMLHDLSIGMGLAICQQRFGCLYLKFLLACNLILHLVCLLLVL